MSSFVNNLEDKLKVMEQKIGALPQELDSVVAHLNHDKLRRLIFHLDQDCNKLFDKPFNAQVRESGMWGSNILVFPFILFPDGWNSSLYRRITSEDLAKWREDYKCELRVVIGKDRVEVIAPSGLASEYKTIVSKVIPVAQQQGYTVLTWDQYLKLLDEIGKLIGGDEQQDKDKAIEPPGDTAHIAIGIPVTATESEQEVKVIPKSFLF